MHLLAILWGYSKKVGICQLGRGLSLEPHHTGTLISDVPASRIVKTKCLLFKLPSLWNSVTAAQVDLDIGDETVPAMVGSRV